MSKKQNEEGITLVALIITVIILIILSVVTIMNIRQSRIIEIATKAGEDYAREQIKEKEELDRIEDLLKKDLGSAEGAIKFGDLDWENEKASVTINKVIEEDYRIEYKILDKDDREIKGYTEIVNGGTVSNLNLGDMVIARLAQDTQLGTKYSDTASITVEDLTPPTAPTFTKKSGEEGANGWYIGSSAVIKITPGADGESGTDKTTYKVTGAEKIEEIEGQEVTISTNGKSYITAYTYDKAGNKKASAEYEVKMDNEIPEITKFEAKTATTETIPTEIEVTEVASGLTYEFYYKESTAGEYTKTSDSPKTEKTTSYTYRLPKDGVQYDLKVVIISGAGRRVEKEITGKETVSKNATPVFAQASSATKNWNTSSKTTSFTIKAKANDADTSDKLTYTVYMKPKTSADSAYKVVGTASNQTPGQQATINVAQYNGSNLANFTEYDWKVTVTDGVIKAPVQEGTVNTTKTYCRTYQCGGGGTREVDCTRCATTRKW